VEDNIAESDPVPEEGYESESDDEPAKSPDRDEGKEEKKDVL